MRVCVCVCVPWCLFALFCHVERYIAGKYLTSTPSIGGKGCTTLPSFPLYCFPRCSPSIVTQSSMLILSGFAFCKGSFLCLFDGTISNRRLRGSFFCAVDVIRFDVLSSLSCLSLLLSLSVILLVALSFELWNLSATCCSTYKHRSFPAFFFTGGFLDVVFHLRVSIHKCLWNKMSCLCDIRIWNNISTRCSPSTRITFIHCAELLWSVHCRIRCLSQGLITCFCPLVLDVHVSLLVRALVRMRCSGILQHVGIPFVQLLMKNTLAGTTRPFATCR